MLWMYRLALISATLGAAIGMSTHADVVYVAANGNDSWSGTLPAPNKTRTDGPFASLERARDAVRQLRKNGKFKGMVTIAVRRGTYYLRKPLELTAEDSDLILTSFNGENVTISGGQEISGFTPVQVNGHRMIAAEIPEVREGKWYFSQLFVNGRRRPRTRLPKDGWYRIESLVDVPADTNWNQGQDRFRFKEGEIRQWKNLSDVDVVALHFWIEERMPVKAVDEAARVVELTKKSIYRLTEAFSDVPARYFLENVFEALDTPGQWYLDRPTGTLYYYPLVGEDWKRAKFVAPALCEIVRVVGRQGEPVKNVHFRGLRFAHAEYHLPPDSAGYPQAAYKVPGAVYFEQAVRCMLSECDISHIGNYAVEFENGCKDCVVERSRMVDLGAGGVKINWGSERTTVQDCEIGDGGKIFMSAVGVWIAQSADNKILHNEVHDLNYTGVSVGWSWGYGKSDAKGNIIEQNHIHHIGRGVLSDLGGIYSLGIQPGTVLRNNLIHDSAAHWYGGWGIYTDEGSSYITIENNVVYNTTHGGFHQHYGMENVVQNNIFAFAKYHQLQRTRPEEHHAFTFERNIVYYDEGALLASSWNDDHFTMDYNIYWDASGRPVAFLGGSLQDWQKRGHDVHSLIADPKFVDAKKFDFRLRPDSPAFALGFKQIDVSKTGPREKPGPGGPKPVR
ncbi:MAG: right-handed parallel beta-helix repeat-containing protein [Armatimonadota bacterium]